MKIMTKLAYFIEAFITRVRIYIPKKPLKCAGKYVEKYVEIIVRDLIICQQYKEIHKDKWKLIGQNEV